MTEDQSTEPKPGFEPSVGECAACAMDMPHVHHTDQTTEPDPEAFVSAQAETFDMEPGHQTTEPAGRIAEKKQRQEQMRDPAWWAYRYGILEGALRLIATAGFVNRSREECEQLAIDALEKAGAAHV